MEPRILFSSLLVFVHFMMLKNYDRSKHKLVFVHIIILKTPID